MAKTYDQMTLAELRGLAAQRMDAVMNRVGTLLGPTAETVPEPTEPPVTDMPLPAARAQAAKLGATKLP